MSMSWAGLIGPLQPVAASAGLRGWYEELCAAAGDADSLGLAVLGGRLAATPGLAFLAGYQAALRALWPEAPAGLGALCATERRTLRPADMSTRWDGVQLNGSKDFVTTGDAVQWLLVSAREEGADESPRLGLFAVEPTAAGVALTPGPSLPIVPDIPHARLQLAGAPAKRLAGDGWSDYVKPFRTHEDLHVLAALTAWLYGVALREQWPRDLQLRLLAILGGAAEVARLPADEPATHLLLAAQLEQFAALQGGLDSVMARGEVAALWQRDRGVLALARDAQARRLEQACRALGLG
ncbi:acyl-CoA dehydrogenase [Stutzerimonas stutzeri]|uniref:acyl-CoA dehydrogenase n=1 Tax=Stutzerimonas stutzeri TaxID=316 RepID=UPI002449D3AA|nr:acyl-CoA dehydrogenase [Stutzerimonas stutzeri]MDH0083169.1 acyl-CoA dehydrogenase family protein [Stutzerimonas stutzeri]